MTDVGSKWVDTEVTFDLQHEGKKEKVKFTTLDAGEPVNAKVKFGNVKKATGDDGKVKIKIKRKAENKKVKAKATADCFASDQLKVKVKKLKQP